MYKKIHAFYIILLFCFNFNCIFSFGLPQITYNVLGKAAHWAISAVYPLFYVLPRLNKLKKATFDSLKNQVLRHDLKADNTIKNILHIDPHIIYVVPSTSLQHFSDAVAFNNEIFISEKIYKQLTSNDPQEKYRTLAIIAHEYNHIKNGEEASENSLLKRQIVGYVGGIIFVSLIEILLKSTFNIDYTINSLKKGIFSGALKLFFIEVLQRMTLLRFFEKRADVISHADPVEHYKLVCGLENFLCDEIKKKKILDDFILKQFSFLPPWLVKLFIQYQYFTDSHPSDETRLHTVHKTKEALIYLFPAIKEKITNNTLWA